MRVLELVLKWGSGGVEHYVEDLVVASSSLDDVTCAVTSVTTGVSSETLSGFGPIVEGGLGRVFVQGDAFRSYIKEGNFDIVHIHGNNGLAFFFAHLAVKAGAKSIVHSHNSSFGPGNTVLKELTTKAMRSLYMKDCSALLACSRAAGDFLFDGAPYEIAKNGIDVDRFEFDPETRKSKRAELEIPDSSLVCGFAASLIEAKNPLFALDIFRVVKAQRPDAVFLVCGDGDQFELLKEAANDLSASCVFVGRVSDIEDYYSVMDVLFAPSKYEGLPINLIEAQASGLPVVMSDSITEEVVIASALCRRRSLLSSAGIWASDAIDLVSAFGNRELGLTHWVEAICAAGYSQPECFDKVFEQYRALSLCR